VTPLGLTGQETWAGLVAGKSGIGLVTLFDASSLPVRIAGSQGSIRPVHGFKEARRIARISQLTLAMGVQAMARRGLWAKQVPDPERGA